MNSNGKVARAFRQELHQADRRGAARRAGDVADNQPRARGERKKLHDRLFLMGASRCLYFMPGPKANGRPLVERAARQKGWKP